MFEVRSCFCWAVILAMSATSARAEFIEGRESLLDEPGYYTTANLPAGAKPEGLDRVLSASLSLEFQGGSACSGFVTAKSGYVVTALHCLQSCFGLLGIIQSYGRTGISDFRYYGPTRQMPACDRLVAYTQSRQVVGQNPQVVAYGTGYTSFGEDHLKEVTDEEAKYFAENFGDWAILKFDAFPTNVSCVKAAAAKLAIGDKIWATGYPSATTRSGAPGSSGKEQLISYGTVTNTITGNEYYRAAGFNAKALEHATQTYLGSGHTISDMDIFSGNSGSIAFNSKGEAVGVNIAIACASAAAQKQYYKNTAVTYGIDQILGKIHYKVSNVVFDCVD